MAVTHDPYAAPGSAERRRSWRGVNMAAIGRRIWVWFDRLIPRPGRARELAVDSFNRGVGLAAAGAGDEAIVAYQAVISTGDGELAPQAAFNIGSLCSGDLGAATVAYLTAIDTGHPDVAPKAAFNLGSLLAAAGDIGGARLMLEHARRSGHADVSARAMLALEVIAAQASLGSGPSDRACDAVGLTRGVVFSRTSRHRGVTLPPLTSARARSRRRCH